MQGGRVTSLYRNLEAAAKVGCRPPTSLADSRDTLHRDNVPGSFLNGTTESSQIITKKQQSAAYSITVSCTV